MEEITYIKEPNPLACGQAVLSMLTNTPVEKIIELCGTQKETDLATMKRVLNLFNMELKGKSTAAVISDLPDIAVLSLETPRCWHWSLYCKGTVYDPEHGILSDFPECARKYYFEVTKKPDC